MFLIKEKSFNSDNPIYTNINSQNGLMLIPEARVAKDYFYTGFYERNYIDWIAENFFMSEYNIIDIGAHIGWYTIDMAKKCKHVYSFECSPKSFNYLCANIALNNLDYKVTKYNCALSNSEGTTKYYIRDPKDGGGNGISKFEYDNIHNTETIDVPTKTLDSFNLKNVNFIKIDVEGHEKEVLQGSIQTIIDNNYPKILLESWDDHHEINNIPAKQLRKELFAFLDEIGYKTIKIGTDMFLAEKK